MKKKPNYFLLIILCLFTFVGCGNKIPEGMSEETFFLGERLLETTDQHIYDIINVGKKGETK